MLDERKAAILQAVVQEYIRTAQPVGSNHVAAASSIDVSPATVRNEMAALEVDGYLQQPHTSAGRIPTDKLWSRCQHQPWKSLVTAARLHAASLTFSLFSERSAATNTTVSRR